MDDMHMFEQQLGSGLDQLAGPRRPVDALAISRSVIATTASPRWRVQPMLSATKLLVAGAIVALFGGFLLAGVLTQPSDELPPAAASPSPTTTAELLSRMTTEEVEPGVYRVLDDGAGHDLVAEPPSGVSIASDGSVWLIRASQDGSRADRGELADAILELGEDGTFPLAASGSEDATRRDFVDVAVFDGVAWVITADHEGSGNRGTLASLDDGRWTTHAWPDGSSEVGAIDVTTDGTVWVARSVENGPLPSVARIVDGDWTVLPTFDDPSLHGSYPTGHASFHASFGVADDGTAWLANDRDSQGGRKAPGGLVRFDGEQWDFVDLPVEGRVHTGPLALDREGTLWVYALGTDAGPVHNYLLRLDADGWTVFSGRSDDAHTLDEGDGVPTLGQVYDWEARMAVDNDGRLWIAIGGNGGCCPGVDLPHPLYPPSLDPAPGPIGLLTFDGASWKQYLRGRHVNRVDVADDGTVFATVLSGCPIGSGCGRWWDGEKDWSQAGLYVITPEAVAATERAAAALDP